MEAKEALAFIKSQFIGDFEMQETDNCWTEEDKKADIKWWKEKFQIVEQGLEKLGKLKDIEEKHNIDLLNALSILDNGIWIFYEEGKIINVKPTLKLIDNSYWFEYDYFIYKPNDYGRTWALTREELENEN